MESIKCRNCESDMKVTSISKHNQGTGFFLLIFGIVSIFFGLPLGILLIGFGLYFCIAKENVWFCGDCKTAIPRVDI